MFYASDLIIQYFPWYFILSNHLKNFSLPHWVTTTTGGYPLLAEGEIGALSPINSTALFLFPFPQSVTILYLIYFLTGFVGMFLFLKENKLTHISSFLGSIVFILSGYITSRYFQPSIIFTSLLLPLGMYIILKSKINPKVIFLLAPLIYLQITAGHLQIALISICGYLTYQLIQIILDKRSYLPLLKTFVIIFLGITLSAPQLLPSLKLFTISQRQDWNPMIRFSYSLPPSHLITYLDPGFFGISKPGNDIGFSQFGGGFWELNLTIWTIPFLISLIPLVFIFKKKSRPIIAFYILWIAFLLLSFGGFFKPNHIVAYLPNFPFRAPARFLLISTFAASTLCAIGFDMATKRAGKLKIILAFLVILSIIIQQTILYKSYIVTKSIQEITKEVKNSSTNFTTPLLINQTKIDASQNMQKQFQQEFEKGMAISALTTLILLVWYKREKSAV